MACRTPSVGRGRSARCRSTRRRAARDRGPRSRAVLRGTARAAGSRTHGPVRPQARPALRRQAHPRSSAAERRLGHVNPPRKTYRFVVPQGAHERFLLRCLVPGRSATTDRGRVSTRPIRTRAQKDRHCGRVHLWTRAVPRRALRRGTLRASGGGPLLPTGPLDGARPRRGQLRLFVKHIPSISPAVRALPAARGGGVALRRSGARPAGGRDRQCASRLHGQCRAEAHDRGVALSRGTPGRAAGSSAYGDGGQCNSGRSLRSPAAGPPRRPHGAGRASGAALPYSIDGFVRWASKPASRARSLSSGWA